MSNKEIAYNKIKKCIDSCTTIDQTNSCDTMVNNFKVTFYNLSEHKHDDMRSKCQKLYLHLADKINEIKKEIN
jgi:hypothetical protein